MDHADSSFQREHAEAAPRAQPNRKTLSKAQRLTRSGDIRQAYDQGRKAVGRFMVLWTRKGPEAGLRLGVVASRKVGGAVERARAKRRLRELYRIHRAGLSGEVDVVLVARQALLKAAWPDLVLEFHRLTKQARLTTREETVDTSA